MDETWTPFVELTILKTTLQIIEFTLQGFMVIWNGCYSCGGGCCCRRRRQCRCHSCCGCTCVGFGCGSYGGCRYKCSARIWSYSGHAIFSRLQS